MNELLIQLYCLLLRLYPRQFRAEFGEEMVAVFKEAVQEPDPSESNLALFLRELLDLPGSIFHIYFQYWFGGNMSVQEEYLKPSTQWQAFIGTIPFLTFGIVQMIHKMDLSRLPRSTNIELAFYGLALTGFWIGWLRGFPLWSYSYMGWILVFIWWGTDIRIAGTDLDDQIWVPFGIMILVALLWTRSLEPIKKLMSGIWNDWTRLTLAMFAFAGFMALIYDENHHPQLFWFMLASILTISASSWFFLRSSSLKGRIVAILGGSAGAVIISWICDATWDFHAFHGLTPTDRPWYLTFLILAFWLGVLFWPALIMLIHTLVNRRST